MSGDRYSNKILCENDERNFEIHIENGNIHVHDNVNEAREGNGSWDDRHREPTDEEIDIVNEVRARENE